MNNLNGSNYSVDKDSGAVIFHRSPELLEIIELKNQVKTMNEKLDFLCKLLNKEEHVV